MQRVESRILTPIDELFVILLEGLGVIQLIPFPIRKSHVLYLLTPFPTIHSIHVVVLSCHIWSVWHQSDTNPHHHMSSTSITLRDQHNLVPIIQLVLVNCEWHWWLTEKPTNGDPTNGLLTNQQPTRYNWHWMGPTNWVTNDDWWIDWIYWWTDQWPNG